MLFQATSKAAVEGDRMLAPKKEFGFDWFIPELLKHKQIWRDVLLASLAIQLMALATPVFTQIVIDKVIVHHTTSTLIVIAIGLLVFMLFSTAMTWVRQYLVLHTGNRIDAVLGLQVFAKFLIELRFHLQRLHRFHARYVFRQERLVARAEQELLVEPLAQNRSCEKADRGDGEQYD